MKGVEEREEEWSSFLCCVSLVDPDVAFRLGDNHFYAPITLLNSFSKAYLTELGGSTAVYKEFSTYQDCQPMKKEKTQMGYIKFLAFVTSL